MLREPGAQFEHGIHPVHGQIQHDLLQVDLVGAHRQGGLRLTDAQLDAPRRRLGTEQAGRITNHLVQIELLQLGMIFLPQQATQVIDDVCRALIVPADVGKNFLELIHVGRIGSTAAPPPFPRC